MPSKTVRSSQRGRSRRGVLLGAGTAAGTAIGARQRYHPARPQNTRQYLTQAKGNGWFESNAVATDLLCPFGRVMEQDGTIRDGGRMRDGLGTLAEGNSSMHEDRYPNFYRYDFIPS